jgi:hypothetical protein
MVAKVATPIALREKNMELALIITGGSVPKRLSDHFEAWMTSGVPSKIAPWATSNRR